MQRILRIPGIKRREFLAAGARWGAAALCAGSVPGIWPLAARAQQDVVVPGKERMIVRSLRYLDLEMPVHLLDSWITPVDLFYVRNHLAQPGVNLAAWRLRVTGEVARALELTYADLQKLEPAAVTNTLECAGNGRAFHRPRVAGIQWTRGAVGNAAYAGPRLADVLGLAGIRARGKHVLFDGLDAPSGQVPDFLRSIPIEKAMHPDTLLAMQMNGAPLTIEHGYPVRALVPGWLGAASVKWLIEIRVLEKEFDGNFMKPGYRMPRRPVAPGAEVGADEMEVITSLPVKSLIARPGDGATIGRGPLVITGAAWAGEADVVKVEVSTDGGRSWQSAPLGRDQAKYAWRLWEHRWTPPAPGTYTVMSRATDTTGRTQPMQAAWNPSGYLWNAVDQVHIHVA
jgi:DMSO/TMAO reductase YedYZ molybdopterin-dependent catalytic subunit